MQPQGWGSHSRFPPWGDLLTAYNGAAISYDEIGNPDSYGGRTFTWEHGRELSSLTQNNATWNYTYDSNGMRTSRTNGTKTYNYIYSGSQLVQMSVDGYTFNFTYDASGTPLTVSLNGGTYYYVTNIQGDVVGILNPNGVEVVRYGYDAWGNVEILYQNDPIASYNPLLYRGYVYDFETQLYYLQSRYYNPTIGRFINADALVSTGQGILGNNMFAYCSNNPVAHADPSGHALVVCLKDDHDPTLGMFVGLAGGGGSGGGTAYVLPAAKELTNKVDERVNNKSGAVTRADLMTDGYGFYRGRLVVKLDIMGDSAFSFGVIFTGPNPSDDLLAHEYGHTVHLSQIGVADYAAKVVLPSIASFSICRDNPYYTSQPWEYIAEYFGKPAPLSNGYLACADELAIIYWIFTVLS